MSESDSEFRDLMVESLAQDGILAKIRAQLRAHIYIALENESKITENISNAFHSDYYAIMFLIYDFLNFYNFEYTLSVFEAESDYSNKKHFNNKTDFCKHFNITPEIDPSPMLLEIFQVYKKHLQKPKY
ncbi:FGFR1 oncogene partner-like [Ctenocephalides felis]|uniref:FGFR1 oncogene partner-like n=1 Tax=Ctenocephalides felis TaxID=7515 RepID=UPI000E6E29A7|nr:FGFR1 oncogene partner-like [Ctenocephalides felis]